MNALPTTASFAVAAALALSVGPASVTKDAWAAWKPKKPIELVIMDGKGRGARAVDLAIGDIDLPSNSVLTRAVATIWTNLVSIDGR